MLKGGRIIEKIGLYMFIGFCLIRFAVVEFLTNLVTWLNGDIYPSKKKLFPGRWD